MPLARTAATMSMFAMLIVGCSNTPADLHGLPENDAERATLCSRAAVAYASAAETEQLPQEERDRRTELLQAVVDATDFFDVNGFDEAEGQDVIADIDATLNEGNWLVTLNKCKAAYALGDGEPLPSLPQSPPEKAAACGAAMLIANLDGRNISEMETLLEDQQSAYFLTMAAAKSDGDIERATAVLEEQVSKVVSSGAVSHIKDQCLAEFPKAEPGRTVTLPGADDEAIVACLYAAEIIAPSGEDAKRRGEAFSAHIDGHPAGHVPTQRLDALEADIYERSTDLGVPGDILTACEKRFS